MSEKKNPEELAAAKLAKNPAPSTADAKSAPKAPAGKSSSRVPKAAAATGAAQADTTEQEAPVDDSPGFFGRTMIWASTAWGSSMVIHLLLLLVLAFWFIPPVIKPPTRDIEAVVEDRPDEIITQVLETDTTPSETLTVTSAASALSSGMESTMVAPEPPQVDMQVSDTPTDVTVDVGTVNVFASQGRSLATDVPNGTLGEALAAVEGYSDAMDRITQEILNNLAKSKVLVVWLVDQSHSIVDDDIDEITARIDRVYQELGLSSAATGDALLTSVCAFGESFSVITPAPTYNTEEIIGALNQMKNMVDESGLEHLCPAIGQAVQRHRQFVQQGRRKMMLIVVTDESGEASSNNQYLEATIAEAKSARTPVYFLAREAVFGYPFVRMRWVDPKFKIPFWIRMDRGPETPYPEALQTEGLRNRWDAHPSGFGPYEQARIARETGGIFFMLPSPETNLVRRDDTKYAIEAMRPYLPDLSSRKDYTTERDKYETRRVLWKVITDLNPWDPSRANQVQVRHENFSIDLAQFRNQAAQEIPKAQRLITYFEAAAAELDRIRPQLNREASPRWRANVELVHAQTVAYQVRLYEYIACLEDFVKNPKPIKNVFGPNKPTNNWEVTRIKQFRVPEKHEKLRQRAETMYKQIIKDHAGTPWASRAEIELRQGWGVDLREEFDDPRRSQVKVPKF